MRDKATGTSFLDWDHSPWGALWIEDEQGGEWYRHQHRGEWYSGVACQQKYMCGYLVELPPAELHDFDLLVGNIYADYDASIGDILDSAGPFVQSICQPLETEHVLQEALIPLQLSIPPKNHLVVRTKNNDTIDLLRYNGEKIYLICSNSD